LPSAIALIIFGYGILEFHEIVPTGISHRLKVVAVAVVSQAVWCMARTLCPDPPRVTPADIGQVTSIRIFMLIFLTIQEKHPSQSQTYSPHECFLR
jgi:chromate transporter